MKKVLALLLLITCFGKVKAQTTFQEQVYRLNNTNKVITASTLTKQGNVLLLGPVPAITGWTNIFTLIQPNLDTVWSRKGAHLYSTSQTIQQTSGNGFIYGANMDGPTSPTILLQKLSPTGLPIWSNNYTSSLGLIRSISQLPNKDYLISGGFAGNGFPFIRTDSAGNIKWQKDYTWSQMDNPVIMVPAQNGNFLTAGVTQFPIPTGHLKLLLIDANGDSLKGTQLVVTNSNRQEGMRVTDNSVLSLSDGGFLISASLDTTINNQSGALGMLVKVNSNLQLVWKYIYRFTPVWRQFSKMRELSDGSIIALAYDAPSNSQPASNQFYLYHFNAFGQLLQPYRFTSNLATRLDVYTMEALADSSFIVGGRSYNSLTQKYGFYAAKVKIHNLNPALPLISGVKENFIAETGLGQSYPNPTAAEAIIPYNLPKNYRQASIIIREIATGKEVKSYVLKRNESSLKVDLSNFSNGLYLYSLVIDEKPVATKKLAVIR